MEKFLYQVDKKNPKINMFFAFPAVESFALSSLGFLNIFKNLDCNKDIFVERIYQDTKSTKIPISKVCALGISTSFEIDILAIIKMLQKFDIPLNSKDRTENHPLVFAGGPVISANPLPYQEFYDFCALGDSNQSFDEITKILIEFKNAKRGEILKELNKLSYVFVPSLGKNKKIKKIADVIDEPFATPILSDKSFFKNTYIIEIERGCPNQCNFCISSFLNMPTRFADTQKILNSIDFGLLHTNKIALLGAFVAGHPDFDKILAHIREKNKISPVELSISSLRADLTSTDVVKTLVECGQKSCTIALEAGSERLRKVINKNLSENQILQTIRTIREGGMSSVKIYMMIGHPTETDSDIEEILNLARKIKEQNKGFDVIYSLSTFIPKAQTPFMFARREGTKLLEQKIKFLAREFHKLGATFRPTSVAWDDIQAILSRYPHSLFDYFVSVVNEGASVGTFRQIWRKMNKNGLLPTFEKAATFPFDDDFNCEEFDFIIENKEFLIEKYKKALSI